MGAVIGLTDDLLVRGGVGAALVAPQAGAVVLVLGDRLPVLVDGGELASPPFHVVPSFDIGVDGLYMGVAVVSSFVLRFHVPSGVRELLEIWKERCCCEMRSGWSFGCHQLMKR